MTIKCDTAIDPIPHRPRHDSQDCQPTPPPAELSDNLQSSIAPQPDILAADQNYTVNQGGIKAVNSA
jgi:hypothetical protein